jgi:hypothetical protein
MPAIVGSNEISNRDVCAVTGAIPPRVVTIASRIRIFTVVAILSFAPLAVFADQPPDVIETSTVLKLSLVGRIRSHCGFAVLPPSSADLSDLSHSGSLELNFKLDCNAAFAVAVASSNGGLKRVSSPGEAVAVDGFTTSLDYDIRLAYRTNLGTVSAHCPASSLAAAAPSCIFYGEAASQGLASGDGVAVDAPGSLKLTWQPPAHKHLVAGDYKDTITITVGTRL